MKILFHVQWTVDLTSIPNVTHRSIEDYFCADNTLAYKHKREGCQLFKDNYIKSMRFKPNVLSQDNLFCDMKCDVTASMRGLQYPVKIRLMQNTGDIIEASCTCRASAGGVCKHVSAALFQFVDFKLRNLSSVPEDKSCTERLQQWNIRGE